MVALLPNLFLFLIRANCSEYGPSKLGRMEGSHRCLIQEVLERNLRNVPSSLDYCCSALRVLAAWPCLPHCRRPDPRSIGLSCTRPTVQPLYGKPLEAYIIVNVRLNEACTGTRTSWR